MALQQEDEDIDLSPDDVDFNKEDVINYLYNSIIHPPKNIHMDVVAFIDSIAAPVSSQFTVDYVASECKEKEASSHNRCSYTLRSIHPASDFADLGTAAIVVVFQGNEETANDFFSHLKTTAVEAAKSFNFVEG